MKSKNHQGTLYESVAGRDRVQTCKMLPGSVRVRWPYDQDLIGAEAKCARAIICFNDDAGESRFVLADLQVLWHLDCEQTWGLDGAVTWRLFADTGSSDTTLAVLAGDMSCRWTLGDLKLAV